MDGTNSNLTSGNIENPQMKFDNYEHELTEKALENEYDKNDPYAKFPLRINKNKQNKHNPENKNYINGRSKVTISNNELQSLINKKAKKGDYVSPNKERVNFGRIIGTFVDLHTGKEYKTKIGIIHYSKTGIHVVPANPKEH